MGLLTKKVHPLLPLRDMVIFPGVTTVLSVASKSYILTVERAFLNNEQVFCIAHRNKISKNTSEEKEEEEEFFDVGTLCEITQKLNTPSGDLRLFVRGLENQRLCKILIEDSGHMACTTSPIKNSKIKDNEEELDRTRKIVINKAEDFLRFYTKNALDFRALFKTLENDADVLYVITNLLNIDIEFKQSILEEKSFLKKYIKLNQFLEIEINLMDVEKKINEKIDKKIQETQKKFFLKEKLKVIRSELNENDDTLLDDDIRTDINSLKIKMKSLVVREEVKEKFDQEISKLEITPVFSPEYSCIKNYLDWIVGLPWNNNTKLENDIKSAENILNLGHYGLEDIKERILEFIAVFEKTQRLDGSILCLVGPPGVGKTSLAKSIAEATNRKYIRISLGGIRDEAEIRGHRRTYVGAMPGKIIQSIRRAKTNNPLILLDEIDKMSYDYQGDPASAILEVLDPEQNNAFSDNFLELEYDLSNIMFVSTANSLHNLSSALQDRMEVIKLSGYTEDEKLHIAKNHLVRKQLDNNGLEDREFSITDEAILKIIRSYTAEAGVRDLERNLEKLMRKSARKIVENNNIGKIEIGEDNLKDYLSVEKNFYNKANKEEAIGVSTGLAYTDFGGDILHVEALKFDGNGKILITGKLGDVMKESAEAAFSYVRSCAGNMHINSKIFNKYDFHLHVPEGATPKDGPSAGVAMSVALMSALAGLKVRNDTAMTGEITLTGKVLPIGGLKEKLLAALRGDIKHVLIPRENVKDLEKIPDNVKEKLNIVPLDTVEEAFNWLIIGYQDRKRKKIIDKNKGKNKNIARNRGKLASHSRSGG
ncbi:MAG: endopeptidase La [Rickettsiales bacterium]|jgi:ATP-dependent Lon protease|nr:endopeptidase La [Rickettsiales bacterium]